MVNAVRSSDPPSFVNESIFALSAFHLSIAGMFGRTLRLPLSREMARKPPPSLSVFPRAPDETLHRPPCRSSNPSPSGAPRAGLRVVAAAIVNFRSDGLG